MEAIRQQNKLMMMMMMYSPKYCNYSLKDEKKLQVLVAVLNVRSKLQKRSRELGIAKEK